MMIKIAFTGNPNVGKTALINSIAGSNLKVGSWPGVTVEKKEAEFMFGDEKIQLIDLPGVYSLASHTVEERITRDGLSDSEIAFETYYKMLDTRTSKAITAQWLVAFLLARKDEYKSIIETDDKLNYIVDAIRHAAGV